LLWLKGEGHPVLGVEISPIAVDAFFREDSLEEKRMKGRNLRHGKVIR
jgi:thiopurine S-methyltransferase